MLPDIWIVAHNGTTNPATPSLTPKALVRARVTGIVAADDCVPNAVKYAGIIRHNSFSGLRVVVENSDATENYKSNTAIWIAKITKIILAKVMSIGPTSSAIVIFIKMPKI